MSTIKLKIRLYGDPVLRKKASEIDSVDASLKSLISKMIEMMYESKGIGLAAPQVGIDRRLFVADIGEGPIAFINPRIHNKEGLAELEEGCLSIPGINVNVKRPEKITVTYTDEDNKKQERVFVDLMARVIQHENDHLNGKLIVDYASFSEKMKFRSTLKDLKKIAKEQSDESNS